jgi:hypothetical protein
MSIDLGTAAYTFEAKIVLNAAPTFLGGLLGRNGTSSGFFITPTLSLAGYVTNTLRYQTAANFFLVDGNVHTYRLEHDAGGAWRAYRDGSLFGSGTFSSSTVAAPLIWIGQGNNSSNSFCSMDLEYLEVTGVTNAQKWNADLSGGTGSTLPTVSGSNQATLINFPTDNSQWISAGGATAYADVLSGFTMSQSVGNLAAVRGYSAQLSGVLLSYSAGSAESTRGYSSLLNGVSYSLSVGDMSTVRGYSSLLNGGTYAYAVGNLESTSASAIGRDDALQGVILSFAVGSLVSTVQRNTTLAGLSYTSTAGALSASLAHNSALLGLAYSASVNTLTSTWSGEVTVTIEGYTIRYADSIVAAAYANDIISAGYAADILEQITWQH